MDKNGWQPIETAPKDGRKLDLWTFNGERWVNAFWHQGQAGWVMSWRGPSGELGYIYPLGQPTHWMLPPEAPENPNG